MGALDGKVAIVTGGARGQGEAEAHLILAEGGRVVIGDILEEAGEALAAELGPHARFVRLDVGDERCWEAAVALATAEFGALDLLVNNAGYSTTTLLVDLTVDELDRVYAINQRGVALGMKHAARAMRARGLGGAIVNITSIAGVRAMRGKVAYGGAKAAVKAMTEHAALELAADGIRVNAVLPGIINTAMVANAPPDAVQAALDLTPIGRLGEAEDIAPMVVFLLSDKASFITGATVAIDGGYCLS